jgi:hypothetical protein
MIFPKAGDYKLFADVLPTGGEAAVLSEWISVADGDDGGVKVDNLEEDGAEDVSAEEDHNEQSHDHTSADKPVLESDADEVKIVDGTEFHFNLSSMQAGEEAVLTYTLHDEETGKEITNLEPYLGAVGHVVILSADAERYLHVHPIDEQAAGPQAQFATEFPEAGLYKIWAQFQRSGKVITVPYTVEIG